MWTLLLLVGCPGEPAPEPPDRVQRAAPAPAEVPLPRAPTPTPAPVFTSRVEPVPEGLRAKMRGTTWREGCPVALEDLVLITLNHRTFGGGVAEGKLVVRADLAPVYVDAFSTAFESGFAFTSVLPASAFGGDDDASMAANNTSAFNCRKVTGGSSWSQHSHGNAIDINPRQNPYVMRSGKVLPPEGEAFLDRKPGPGVLLPDSPVTRVFLDAGWGWGGQWRSLKDYQHFSESGR